MKLKKIYILLVLVLVTFYLLGCTIKKDEEKEKKESKQTQNLKINLVDYDSNLDVITEVIDKFKEENDDIKVDMVITKDVNKNNFKKTLNEKADIIICNRKDMINLKNQGFLKNLNNIYSKFELDKKYYDIAKYYGRINSDYFGIGLIAESYELMYNENVLQSYNTNKEEFDNIENILIKMNQSGISIPILTGNNLNYLDIITSYFLNNEYSMNEMVKAFNKDFNEISNILNLDNELVKIKSYYDKALINNNTFSQGNSEIASEFINDKIPFVICNSNFLDKFHEEKLKIVNNTKLFGKKFINMIDINTLFCVASSSENEDTVDRFLKFMLDEKNMKELVENNIITCSPEVNGELKDKYKEVDNHLQFANEDDMILFHNMNDENYNIVTEQIKNALQIK